MKFVGERRAIAAAVLSFFMLQFIIGAIQIDDEFRAVRSGLGAAYLIAFLGVVSGWFWARWYTLGLAFSGTILAAMIAWQIGFDPAVYVLGGGHILLAVGLLGDEAAAFFDGRKDWRERWRMDENAVNRLGKAVMRAGASLPYLIVAGLGPKAMFLGAAALGLGLVGLAGVIRLRTWGLLVLGLGALTASVHIADVGADVSSAGVTAGWLAAALLAAAVAPFAGPIVRSLRAR